MKTTTGLSKIQNNPQSQVLYPFFSKALTFFALCIFILSTHTVFSQNEGIWKLYSENDGIKIFTKKAECHDNVNGLHYEYVFIKIQNTSNINKNVTLDPALTYGDKQYPQASDNNATKSILIKAGNEIQGDCSENTPECLKIFSRFLNYSNKPSLSTFELNPKIENTQTDE